MTTWTQLSTEIEEFTCGIRNLRVSQNVTPALIRSELEQRYTFDKPIPLETLTADVSSLLRKWDLHVTHPRYFGLFNPSVRQAGIVADALVALYNPQLAVWSHAPVANEIEKLTLRVFTEAIGFNHETTMANFTSGGAEANFSAVLAALIQRFPGMAESGLASLGSRPIIYLTGESHHSFVKIARMTGLGTQALHEIPTAPNYQGVSGLLRKTYIYSEDGVTVGGVYLWNSRQEAEAMYTEEWFRFVREKYGTEATVTYFESPVVVDNVTHEILTEK
jgi:hypothetical protein